MTELPVEAILAPLAKSLQQNMCAVLQAPPGAGKTTRVPLALLDQPWLKGQRILILQPRRLATRAAAARMAATLGERMGDTVGYRMRMESRVGPRTRVEVLTEGVLTRLLQRDPALAGVGLVIFDEFHERNLTADLGLALCLDVRGVLNESLRILVMSATLDSRPLAHLMHQAAVVTCEGRQFPVETVYAGAGRSASLAQNTAAVICRTLKTYTGSLLVFLPGAPEIRAVQALLQKEPLDTSCRVAPLFGNLTRAQQQQAIAAAPEGQRKIVLATDIAETSLTIEGIGVVVDSGFRRAPQYDVASGMTRLVTLPVSRASAGQRRGRAGRLGPGVCVRMWDQNRHHMLKPHNRPEILETDLAPLALELAIWGVRDYLQLKWLDPPPEAAIQEARHLLVDLGALTLDSDGAYQATPQGGRMAALGLHPRLAHMLLMAVEAGTGPLACRLAALLSERDIIRFKPGEYEADVQLRLDVLAAFETGRHGTAFEIDSGACRRILQTAGLLEKRLKISPSKSIQGGVGRLLAWAYPDRLAQQRPGSRRRYLLSNGRGARFYDHALLCGHPYLAVAALDGDRREARIFLAATYDETDLVRQFKARIRERIEVAWNSGTKAVEAHRTRMLEALPLSRTRIEAPPAGQVLAAMLEGIRREGMACLSWTKALRSWQARIMFLRRLPEEENNWPDVSDLALAETLETWLGPCLTGIIRLKQLAHIDLKSALYGLLTWPERKKLENLAPTHLQLPSGTRVPIDYQSDPPVVAARIQQMFGATCTPTVASGRQPLVLHLLSPAGRPMQITSDLAGFWANSYHAVKKDLKARYPKHHWPDDPLKAVPTDRAKPRGPKK